MRFGTFVNEQTADLAEVRSEGRGPGRGPGRALGGSKQRLSRVAGVSQEEEQLEEAPTRRRRRQASSDEEEEEAAPALQPRRKRARNAMPAETEDDQEEESNLKPAEDDSSSDSEGEEEQPVAAGKRPRGGSVKRTRTPVTSAALKPWVPPPPSEPRTRADMLSLLFACPALIGGCCMQGLGAPSCVAFRHVVDQLPLAPFSL